jgi:hypothetical protein
MEAPSTLFFRKSSAKRNKLVLRITRPTPDKRWRNATGPIPSQAVVEYSQSVRWKDAKDAKIQNPPCLRIMREIRENLIQDCFSFSRAELRRTQNHLSNTL